MHASQVWCDGESFICTVLFFEEVNTAYISATHKSEEAISEWNQITWMQYLLNPHTGTSCEPVANWSSKEIDRQKRRQATPALHSPWLMVASCNRDTYAALSNRWPEAVPWSRERRRRPKTVAERWRSGKLVTTGRVGRNFGWGRGNYWTGLS
jgi:hypothetical protein